MKVCGQCGEMAAIGGYVCIPDQPLNEKWRCVGCLSCDLNKYSKNNGKSIKNVLVVKRPDEESASNDTVSH